MPSRRIGDAVPARCRQVWTSHHSRQRVRVGVHEQALTKKQKQLQHTRPQISLVLGANGCALQNGPQSRCCLLHTGQETLNGNAPSPPLLQVRDQPRIFRE